MIDTRYIVVKTDRHGNTFIENGYKSFSSYQDAIKYRDLKREIESLENENNRFNVASFNLVNGTGHIHTTIKLTNNENNVLT
jgi:hypothetical protein